MSNQGVGHDHGALGAVDAMPPVHFMNRSPAPPDFTALSMASVLEMGLTLREIVDFGLIRRFTEHRLGSRYLLQIVGSLRPDLRVHAVDETVRELMRMRVDWVATTESVFGHHLIQRLFEYGDRRQHQMLLDHFVNGSALSLSRSKFGCRVVQWILPLLDRPQRERLVDCFRAQCTAQRGAMADALRCVNGSHVIQKMVRMKLPFQSVAFIASALEQDLGTFYRSLSAPPFVL